MDRSDADLMNAEQAVETMQGEWGESFSERVTAMQTIISTAPDELDIEAARLPDGTRLFDSPAFLRWLGGLLYDEIDLGGEADESVSDGQEKAEIERIMREEPQRYWADESLQDRYRLILEKETAVE